MASFFGTKKEPIGPKIALKSVHPFDGQREGVAPPRRGTTKGCCAMTLASIGKPKAGERSRDG
jgi:hypothetical protein